MITTLRIPSCHHLCGCVWRGPENPKFWRLSLDDRRGMNAAEQLIHLEKSGFSAEDLRDAFQDLKPQLSDRLDSALTMLEELRAIYGDRFKAA